MPRRRRSTGARRSREAAPNSRSGTPQAQARFWRVTDAPQSDDGRFVRRALIVIALGAGVFLLWQVRTVLALLFGAVMVATIFRAIGDVLHKHLRLPIRIAVMVSVLLVAGVIALIAWLVGSQVSAQSQQLADTLPRAAQLIDERLAGLGFGHPVGQSIQHVQAAGLIGSDLKGFLSSASLSVASFLIVFFGGIFLAAQPRLYGIGAIKLIPPGAPRACRRGDGGIRPSAPAVAQGTAVGDDPHLPDDLGRPVAARRPVRAHPRAHFRRAGIHSLCRGDNLGDPGNHGRAGPGARARPVGRRALTSSSTTSKPI